MANDMIKFYKGLEASLPAAGTSGALYITTDEGAIYLGTGTGMKRLGDFVQVANVASLPAKAHENCLYYCVAENILAKWNGTEWKQVNKQPTTEELKTLLGLGSMAYVSTVVESNLSAELVEKINASADGNHSHSNKGVLDGITAAKVTAWDAAEANAIAHADELDDAMNTRVLALEAIDHEHANKALLDTYTQTEANLADAVAKKHEHANAAELAKIVDGDKAKWDAVAADYLTSADKTTLENSIKDAKKAGTDANTALETYKVTNDAAIDAIEEDIAEITDATNGILAQAKSYSDGKLATARTEIGAEIDADVKVVADELAGYKTSNDAALAGVKATAEAAATKAYTDEELAKKVDKVTGKSLVADTEIAKLAGVSAGANKVEASEANGYIRIDGTDVEVYTHPSKHTVSDISDFDDAVKAYNYATKADAEAYANGKDAAIAEAKKAGTDAQAYAEGVAGNLATHAAEAEGKYETKTDATNKANAAKDYTDGEIAKVQGAVDALETYVGTIPTGSTATNVIAYVQEKTAGIATEGAMTELGNRVGVVEGDVATIKGDYLKAADKTELEGAIADVQTAVDGEKERAEGIEAGLRTDVDAIKADYLKAADKTALQDQITANANAITVLTDGIDPNKIDGLTDLVNWANVHAPEVQSIKDDIEANAKAIADQATADAATYETKSDATSKKNEIDGRLNALETKVDVEKVSTAISTAVAAEKAAREQAEADLTSAIEDAKTEAANKSAVVLAEAQSGINAVQASVDAVNDAMVEYQTTNNAAVDSKANASDVYTKEQVDTMLTDAMSWGEF